MEKNKLVTRAVQSMEDIKAVVELCAAMFPEEARATGMSISKWTQIKIQELSRRPGLWPQWGVACEEQKIIGGLIMTVDEEPGALLSYWSTKLSITRSAGLQATLLTCCYDQVLEEALKPHECLIDFIVVSPEARGKGVGTDLMRWAETRAAGILSQRAPAAIAAHGVQMTLWVAADNAPACKLYEKEGYLVVKKTDEAMYSCFSSLIFRTFLGHPVWHKMCKHLPPPPNSPPHEQHPFRTIKSTQHNKTNTVFLTAKVPDFE